MSDLDEAYAALIDLGNTEALSKGVFSVRFGDGTQGFFISKEMLHRIIANLDKANKEVAFLLVKQGEIV